jgi:hypothetical protein
MSSDSIAPELELPKSLIQLPVSKLIPAMHRPCGTSKPILEIAKQANLSHTGFEPSCILFLLCNAASPTAYQLLTEAVYPLKMTDCYTFPVLL